MAHTFQNLSFEIVGFQPGEAAGWTQSELASAEEIACYGPSSLSVRRRPEEDFEDGWLSNEDFVFVLGLVDDAFYDIAISPQRGEDYEEGWLSNENFTFVHSGLDVAVYDSTPQDFEDFEEEWLGNEAFEFQLGTILSAPFGGVGGSEDFEQTWDIDIRIFAFAEFSGLLTFTKTSDEIERASGSWITDGFADVPQIEIFNSLSNDGIHDPVTVTALSIITDGTPAIVDEVPALTVRVRSFSVALYDGGALTEENFQGTWTLMTTF